MFEEQASVNGDPPALVKSCRLPFNNTSQLTTLTVGRKGLVLYLA